MFYHFRYFYHKMTFTTLKYTVIISDMLRQLCLWLTGFVLCSRAFPTQAWCFAYINFPFHLSRKYNLCSFDPSGVGFKVLSSFPITVFVLRYSSSDISIYVGLSSSLAHLGICCADCISTPRLTAASAILFVMPPTPSHGPLPCPFS